MADLKLLFLDIDGVLNLHTKWPNGYGKIEDGPREHFNSLLAHLPDVQIVLSSAWRYACAYNKAVAMHLLCSHGLNVYKRVHGCTCPDSKTWSPEDAEFDWNAWGLQERAKQIRLYVEEHQPSRFVVVDDLPLDIPELVWIDPKEGLTVFDLKTIADRFSEAGREQR